mgnify:CR=1 FL=1
MDLLNNTVNLLEWVLALILFNTVKVKWINEYENNIKKKYENKHKFKYDLVIKSRPDVLFKSKLKILNCFINFVAKCLRKIWIWWKNNRNAFVLD